MSPTDELTDVFSLLQVPEYMQKILVVSTAHYPHHTELALFDDENDPLHSVITVDALSHGWQVLVTDEPEAGQEEEEAVASLGHGELAGLMKLARVNGFNFIKLDPDALALPQELGFPVFNW